MNRSKCSRIEFVLAVSLLGALTGCVGYVDGPRVGVYAPPPPVYVESEVALQDDYVYYPGYEVYYSGRRHQYVYLEGRSWVSRPAPPRVSVGVLFASPSVRLGFHDSPAMHHAEVARQYPRQWAPPRSSRGNNQGHEDRNQRGHD